MSCWYLIATFVLAAAIVVGVVVGNYLNGVIRRRYPELEQ